MLLFSLIGNDNNLPRFCTILMDKGNVHVFIEKVHDLEFAQIESQVVQGLKMGNESLKKMHEVCLSIYFFKIPLYFHHVIIKM